jgi:hypothetical protein
MVSQETENEEIEVLYNNCYGGWGVSNKAKDLYKLRKMNNSINDYLSKRSDPILIQIYHELGDEFDQKYSKTAIEKIPKKYEKYYFISEYDGLETVEIDYTKYKLDNLYSKIKIILQHNYDNNTKINEIEQFIQAFEM